MIDHKTSDEAYEEFVADIILTYFATQLNSGRSIIYENEIWQMLGMELPEGQENRKFYLKRYKNNVIPFPSKNKLN
jgi:hypothetical protein